MLTYLTALFTEPTHFLLSLTPLSRFLPATDHFAPHPAAPFEGYYTRIVTPSNSTILIIFSSVHQAPDKPHYVHFSHIPPASSPQDKALKINLFPRITGIPGDRKQGGFQEFTCVASDGLGYCITTENGQKYSLRLPDPDGEGVVEVDVTVNHRTPWNKGDVLSTPEGAFANLAHLLPLHWNVFSHKSVAGYTVRRNGMVWLQGEGIAHVEKNWGVSFPSGWTWLGYPLFFLPPRDLAAGSSDEGW